MQNENKIYDLAIIGSGPAGISAAINARSRGLDFILIGAEECSNKVWRAPEIKNYAGFNNISGEKLCNKFSGHLEKMDIKLKKFKVDNIYDLGDHYRLMGRDQEINARVLILAVGVSNEKLIPGEDELLGKGISYCATCDGPLYQDKNIAAIVYTEEALEEIDYLSGLAARISLITKLDIKEGLADNVEIIEKKVIEIKGEEKIESLIFKDSPPLTVDGAFIFRQVTPPDKLLPQLETQDNHLKVKRDMSTSLQGVFAAGDCTGYPYQIGKAVGEGLIAALSAASYIYKIKK